jgi:spore coat polysaccharide biosynthesis predicted glycosyltransferase SpsG
LNNKQVIIRADGNSEIGYGHIFRCLALAQMLNEDFECWFYSQNPPTLLKQEIEKVAHGLKPLPVEHNFEKEARQLTHQ